MGGNILSYLCIGCVAFPSLSIIWYMIRKQKSEAKARAWLNAICCNMLIVVGSSQEQIKEAINTDVFVEIVAAGKNMNDSKI